MNKCRDNFLEKWEKEREMGWKKYYIKHLGGMAFMMMGMFGGTTLARKEIIVEYLLISFIVIMLFPLISWVSNESRFRISKKKPK